MFIYSHWTLFGLGWDCSLNRAITLNWGDNLPTCPTSPLFPGYLLINPAALCSFLPPSRLDNNCLVVFASLSTGGSRIQRPSMPSTVHPPTRSVSTRLLVSLLTWYTMISLLPSKSDQVCWWGQFPFFSPYARFSSLPSPYWVNKQKATINKTTVQLAMKRSKLLLFFHHDLNDFVQTMCLFLGLMGKIAGSWADDGNWGDYL